jgi:hypothetical protein
MRDKFRASQPRLQHAANWRGSGGVGGRPRRRRKSLGNPRDVASVSSISRKARDRATEFQQAGTMHRRNEFAAPNAIAFPQARTDAEAPDRGVWLSDLWLVGAVSCLYWLASFILLSHNTASNFGADSTLYTAIADGDIQDRLIRFHPVTVALAFDWMKAVSPLSEWVAPHHLITMLFAAIGGLGVWAALSAFRATVPARYVMLCGLIYAFSLGTWYFAAIAESKILTASFATLYIALYLRLRDKWSVSGAWLLTGVLGVACLNEIVAAFLIAIPAVDTFLRRGFNLRDGRWIAAHALVVLAALFILEVTINGRLPHDPANIENGSLFKMFWFYVGFNDHGVLSLYNFLLNWFFFNIVAPTSNAYASVPLWPDFHGYFEPSFSNYLSGLISAGAIILLGVMLVACVAPAWRPERQAGVGLALPLAAYTVLRGAFFFMFNPAEPMLFTSAVTLANLMIVIVPFAASRFPAKTHVLAGFAALLFLTNARFMIN